MNYKNKFVKLIERILTSLKDVKFIKDVAEYIKLLTALVVSYRKKAYTKVNWSTIIKCVGSLLYLVVPVNVIPGFIPSIGYLDDKTVILACVKSIKDLDAFKKWQEENQKSSDDVVSTALATI